MGRGAGGRVFFVPFRREFSRSILIDFLQRRSPPLRRLQPPIYAGIDINCLALGRFYFSFATSSPRVAFFISICPYLARIWWFFRYAISFHAASSPPRLFLRHSRLCFFFIGSLCKSMHFLRFSYRVTQKLGPRIWNTSSILCGMGCKGLITKLQIHAHELKVIGCEFATQLSVPWWPILCFNQKAHK